MENKKRDRDDKGDKVTNVDEPETKRKRVDEETGKPQPTDEKKEELLTSEGGKPTFICAIYRRDILSFLPRRKIEEMRTLSKSWNYDIITTSPDYLPRIIYKSLEVLIGKGHGHRLTKDGYVNGSDRWKVNVDIRGRAIQREIYWFSRCCKEIKEKAGQELNGQLVFPHRDADDVVVVRLQTNTSSPVFRAPNKLTEETAGTLIHFLSHIDWRCVRLLQVQPGLPELSDERGEPIGALNPLIFNTYRAVLKKRLRLYAKRVEMVLPASKTSFRTARQLVGKFRGYCSSAREVDVMLALLTAAHSHCSMIEFQSKRHGIVDRFVEHYRDYTGDIDSLVPEVHLPNLWTDYGFHWPATCPREGAQAMVERQNRYGVAMRKYTYTFENAASGRKFEVILSASSDQWEWDDRDSDEWSDSDGSYSSDESYFWGGGGEEHIEEGYFWGGGGEEHIEEGYFWGGGGEEHIEEGYFWGGGGEEHIEEGYFWGGGGEEHIEEGPLELFDIGEGRIEQGPLEMFDFGEEHIEQGQGEQTNSGEEHIEQGQGEQTNRGEEHTEQGQGEQTNRGEEWIKLIEATLRLL